MSKYSPPSSPARPRNAASLVLYKRDGDEVLVLMGKRAKGHRFLPDVYVFPGGRVDEEDFHQSAKSPLRQSIADSLSRPGDMAHALATAAVRETYEETGLIVGDLKNDQLIPDLSNLDYIARAITPVQSPIRFNTRFLMVDADHAQGTLGGSGELINLQWVTVTQALKMPVVDVTEFVLQEVDFHTRGKNLLNKDIPLFTYLKGKAFIRKERM